MIADMPAAKTFLVRFTSVALRAAAMAVLACVIMKLSGLV
jgi:hypothetical protein